MKNTFAFNPEEIETGHLERFDEFINSHLRRGTEPSPGSLSILAPKLPGAERFGLAEPRVRLLYQAIATHYPRLVRWVSAGRFTRELVVAGISDLQVRWDEQEDCPRYSYSSSSESARWAEIEAAAFPELITGGVVPVECEDQWRDLHNEF